MDSKYNTHMLSIIVYIKMHARGPLYPSPILCFIFLLELLFPLLCLTLLYP